MIKIFYRLLIDLTNNVYLSNIIKYYTTSTFSRAVIPSFAKTFKINIDEANNELHDFKSLHDFFIRKLKAEARPIDPQTTSVISPVDAFIEDIGTIDKQKDIIVKGQTFSIEEMLGSNEKFPKYDQGTYLILYLSPSDYHRIHSPISGEILEQWELGGKSYPVNNWGLKYGRTPLAKNYRMLSEVRSQGKHIVIAKVGAMFINSVTLTHQGKHLVKGDEIGYFSFGSTVVLLFEKDSFTPIEGLKGGKVKMGQKIGIFLQL